MQGLGYVHFSVCFCVSLLQHSQCIYTSSPAAAVLLLKPLGLKFNFWDFFFFFFLLNVKRINLASIRLSLK